MESNKTVALRECRRLLRLINCDAVVETNDEKLCDVLFHSEEKKTILLSWLIQRLYSPETCKMNSFEELLSMFIPKKDQKNFMTGTMPIAEQYKKWKLTMTTLHRLNERKTAATTDVTRRVLDGSLLNSFEESWNEKSYRKPGKAEFTLSPLMTNTRCTIPQLERQLQQAGELLNDLNLHTKQGIEPLDTINIHNETDTVLDEFNRAEQLLNKELDDLLLSRTESRENPESHFFTRSTLDESVVKDVRNNLKTLLKASNTLQLLRGVESFQPSVA